MLPMLLFNVVSGLVMDKAQNLAKDHVGKMIDDILPDDAKEELNAMIKEDPEHEFESIEVHYMVQLKVNYLSRK